VVATWSGYLIAVNHERRDAMRGKVWAPAGFAAAALVLAACGAHPRARRFCQQFGTERRFFCGVRTTLKMTTFSGSRY